MISIQLSDVTSTCNKSESELDSEYYTDEEDLDEYNSTVITVPENIEFKEIYLLLCSYVIHDYYEFNSCIEHNYQQRSTIKVDYNFMNICVKEHFHRTSIDISYDPLTRELGVDERREKLDFSCGEESQQTAFAKVCNTIHQLIESRKENINA